jgi:hypothetical protein
MQVSLKRRLGPCLTRRFLKCQTSSLKHTKSAQLPKVKRIGMSVSNFRPSGKGWLLFDLNVGGFLIRGCRWKPQTGAISFPLRKDRKGWHIVVQVSKPFLKQLRVLLASGQLKTPKDRSPCILKIHRLREVRDQWFVFGVTIRGSVTIWSWRWQPLSGSIQPPITYFEGPRGMDWWYWPKRRVVTAPGVAINRLRAAVVKEATELGIIQPCPLI